MNKKIRNVVFYSFDGENGKMHQACIFYTDGTVKNVSHDEGLLAAATIAAEENIKTREDFLKILNKERIYSITGEELEQNFKFYLGTSLIPRKNNELVKYPDKNKGKNKRKKKKRTSKKKKNNFFTRTWNKIKKKKYIKPIIAAVTALTLLAGGIFLGKKLKNDNISNSNNISSEIDNDLDNSSNIEAHDLAYLKLINKTKNKEQRNAMKHQGKILDLFNKDFADKHIQHNSNVKAALTWDEMMALNLAYNTYSKEQIRAMFNGAELDAKTMTDAYKNATLQLMASYVIETRENPVNSSKFLTSKEEQAFVEKYNNLFLKCKETTGQEQINAVNAFYQELYKDFPISNKIREEGISHADGRKKLESYKLAITPIVGAAEMMFQNLNIDHTLSDKATAYFNDLGLCNLAEEKFEKAMSITLSAETDDSIPKYDKFKTTKIEELKFEDNYVINDNYRDLSQLEEFKKWVNLQPETAKAESTKKSTERTKTTTNNTKTTKITNNRGDAVKAAGETAVKNAEEKVNAQISSENSTSKTTAEQQAEQNRQDKQQQEDQKKTQLENDVQASDKDLQDKINNANSSNKPSSEEDFKDHNVDFSPEHSDENGKLNDSVTDITTDGTGDKTGDALPDPNVTGAEFDAKAQTRMYTNEQIVDKYITELEKGSETAESGYQYTK